MHVPVSTEPIGAETVPSVNVTAKLHFRDQHFLVKHLDEFAFEIESQSLVEMVRNHVDTAISESGVLEIGGDSIGIQFKTRKVDGDMARFAFYDMSLETRNQIKRLLNSLASPPKDSLHALSYDDLANGGVPGKRPFLEQQRSDTKAPTNRPAGVRRASLFKKLAALAVMACVMGAIGGMVVYILHSRSAIDVYNGVLVGNYVPVNAPLQSTILELYVRPGDKVTSGDLVAKLSNAPVGNDLLLVETKLRRARSELAAFRTEAEQLRATLQFAALKMERDLGVAEAEIQRAQSQLQAAQAQLKRLEPLMSRGNVAISEYDEAKALLATASAELVRQAALKESLNVAKEAVKSNVLMTTHSVSNPMGELATKITVAEAVVRELEETQLLLQTSVLPVEVRAPTSGEVYAIYRNQGETVKVADQLMAISVDGDTWASGTVDIQLATAIRPGHPVEVSIPSLGITTEGTVEGIGHRSVYGQDGYHAEFRSGPLEVPIRIALDLKGNSVPAGMRLEMQIRVRDRLKELRSWIQQHVADNVRPLLRYWTDKDAVESMEPNTTPNESKSDDSNRNAEIHDRAPSFTAITY